jgi:hypothetical protein
MKALSSQDLLELWERGARLYPLDQGLLALRVALPEVKSETLAGWPLGKRNRALLEWHSFCFSSRLQAWAECASCGEKMEFDMDARDLLITFGTPAREDETVEVNGRTFRLPSSRDLAEAMKEAGAVQGAIRLLQTCCIGQPPAGWTEEDIQIVGEKLASADPAAELLLSLVCPVCGETREEVLDPVTFVWAELGARAKRLLRDIHTLASAYGWTERDILSLSDFRRSQYVEMIHA